MDEFGHDFQEGVSRSMPEALARMVAEERLLIALPQLPAEIKPGDLGQVMIVEKAPQVFVPGSKKHLHTPQVASAKRQKELDVVAQQLGLASCLELESTLVDGQGLRDNPGIPSSLKRHLGRESISVLQALKDLRRASLETAYAGLLLTKARELLTTFAPEMVPDEETDLIVISHSSFSANHYYCGRVNGRHLIVMNLPEELAAVNIFSKQTKEKDLLDLAHELSHQRHAERQGRARYWGNNYLYPEAETPTREDSWQSYLEYGEWVRKKLSSGRLPDQIGREAVTESVAFLIGEYLAEKMGYQSRIGVWRGKRMPVPSEGEGAIYLSGTLKVIKYFANRTPVEQYPESVRQLMEVDLEIFDRPDGKALEQFLKDPEIVFTYPKVGR